jgi:hypothetical protein
MIKVIMNTIIRKKKNRLSKRYGPSILIASGLVASNVDFTHKPYPGRYRNWLKDSDKQIMERE